MKLERGRWDALCARMGLEMAGDVFDDLRAAYGAERRHYHNEEHIVECLTLFDDVRSEAERPDAIEFAIWLHDVVYATRKSDNEERSADLAADWLEAGGAEPPVIEAVRALILATRHGDPPAEADARLLTDIDLHILGADPERFDRYDRDVRREYGWVPKPLYARKRAEVLAGFLERDPLYSTETIRARFEQQAKINLSRLLRR